MAKRKEYIISDTRLMKEWNWEENNKLGLDPKKLTTGSGMKPSWICSKGHKWITSIYHRAKRGSGCPYCSNKKILPGYNDLQSQRPDIMSEWDFETNTIDPSTVAVKSNKVVNWICPKGHKYKKAIYKRTSGEECPDCVKARGTSLPEQCFFYYIKKFYPDAVNRYKGIFDNSMELDIYIPSIKTGIEYDGIFWHDKSAQSKTREEKKYQICKKNDIRLFRIKEGSFTGFSDVADGIWYIPKKCDYQQLDFYITDFLKQLTLFSYRSYDVNVARDRAEILEYKTLKLEDSLQYLYPEIAKEWHPTKNGKLTPDLFVPGSAESVWWLCPNCGNEWQAPIANRTKGHGCDVCAMPKRMSTRKDNILAKRGSIDKEWCLLDWDYEANEYGPEHYTNGSGEVVGWKCHKCGHKWKAAICDRTRDYRNGCPLCSGKTIVSGINDLPTVMPELMQDWDYENNTDIDPTKVGRGSHLEVSWKCHKCGYRWDAQIYNRANGIGCPCCANRVVVPRINDLATTDPDLAAEWHPTLNTLKPTEVTRGQAKMIYWICSKCGNVWKDTINHRTNGRGCRKCKKHI
ncbi:MAG: zinc-ribbon domain-containing protein [Erysipelotrichaceae bacterium]|nr:zinc-ribbon domain-containing protein [Erysipelotrichaceae bacterium]